MSKKIINIATRIAIEEGIGSLTVKRIVTELECTNRVFYNRFCNIDEVFHAIYDNVVGEIRECIQVEYDGVGSYYDYLLKMAVNVVKKSTDNKLHFSQHMFEYDLYSRQNRAWWIEHLKPIIRHGIEQNLLKRVDVDDLAFSVWCFCRGYSVAAIGSEMTAEQITESFKLGFKSFIDGLKP